MTCIVGLLARFGPEIEAQLKPTLAGLAGLFVRGCLPQTWVFDTGVERVSLIVDVNGTVRVRSGAVEPADVLIIATHDTISTALEAANGLRSKESVMRGPTNARFFTAKGEAAFNFLKDKLLA